MGVWQEIEHTVAICQRHAMVIGLQSGIILAVAQHHSLAVARGAARIENIGKVVAVGLLVQILHLRLPWQAFAEFEKIIEINGVGVVIAYTDRAVENHDTFQCMAQCTHTVCLVVLFLFADK